MPRPRQHSHAVTPVSASALAAAHVALAGGGPARSRRLLAGQRDLLRSLERRPAPLRDGIIEPLALAWYPHTFVRLSFGSGIAPAPCARAVPRARALRSPYSRAPLARVETLDHDVPGSFALHDRVWNLAPATRGANAARGARLASPAISTCWSRYSTGWSPRAPLARRTWERSAEAFEQTCAPAGLVRRDPPDPAALREARACCRAARGVRLLPRCARRARLSRRGPGPGEPGHAPGLLARPGIRPA
jgi:hypothetical protein